MLPTALALLLVLSAPSAAQEDPPPPPEPVPIAVAGCASLLEPLDPDFLKLGAANKPLSKAEWQRRLKARSGRASFVPLRPLDPLAPLLVFIPGKGMNFQDAHGLAQLDGPYQLLIGVSDQYQSIEASARSLAAALKEVLSCRRSLEPAAPELRVLGHSTGGLIADLMLFDLARDGIIHDGPRSPIARTLFFAIDAPWRGVDIPWLAMAPGIREAAAGLARRLPFSEDIKKRVTPATLSVANRTPEMNTVARLQLPKRIVVHHVSVLGPLETPPQRRYLEPVANWYSAELGDGELNTLWKFLKNGENDFNKLDGWAAGGLIRKQGLQNLMRALERDADYPRFALTLRQAAKQSKTLEEFSLRYDALISLIVDTFHGAHTAFMWEDPDFLPWLYSALARS